MGENAYMNYQAMVSKVNTSVENLTNICKKLDLHEHAESLEKVSSRLQNHVFRVGIMGEFKRGKSTVINSLLGQEVVPADIMPCSATLNRIVWDAVPHAQINFKPDESGRTPRPKDVSVEELSGYVTKLTSESEEQASMVEDAVVYYPCKFCQDGVEIIDTPGLNDDERMDKISESVIPMLDAIIMVVVPGSPFGISEANFVRNKIMTSDLSRLIFIVNKIDTIRPKDRQRCVDGIREKIEKTILEKAASMYGKDSKEYKTAQSKLGGIRIYPISAADALDGKLEGDDELLNGSGMPEFEEALTKLLTEERGMLELAPTVNAVVSKIKEADETIVMRSNAMNMEQEKFEQMQKEAIEKIKKSREEKVQKVREIKGIAASLYQELQPDVVEAYNAIDETVSQYIENYSITARDFADEGTVAAFQESVSEGINQQFAVSIQENTEKLQVKIQERLSEEVSNLEVYSEKLTADIQDIRCMIPSVSSGTEGSTGGTDLVDMAAMGVEVVTNFTNIVPGLGGAISGFKDYGPIGGLVGLGTGFIATNAAVYATAYVAGAVLGTAAMSLLAPILVIGGVAGAFGGKKITEGIFSFFGKEKKSKAKTVQRKELSENDIVTIRNNLVNSIHDSVNNLRAEHTLENWLKNITDETFETLADRLDRETEDALRGLQETLTNIQVDLGKGEVHQKEMQERLNGYHQDLMNIANTIAPVKEKLDESLSAAE